ncbi:MAG: sulfite exporter TauE/SafE family protein [Ottowia sp.]
MQTSLLIATLFMGLTGGPHCIAMCGAACAGIGQTAAGQGLRSGRALALFQLGRLIGYSAMGALAAASVQGLGALTVYSAALRPVWSMLHIAAIAIGLMLLIWARQPLWLEAGARRIWARVRAAVGRWGLAAPFGLGCAWALLPCGLLYSALLNAALTGYVWQGALAMALFALASGLSLALGPWLLVRFGFNGRNAWSMRLAGLALMLTAGWALWHGLVHQQAPWCVAPGA